MTPEQIVKDDVARAAKNAKQLDPSPPTSKSEIKLNTPVLLATRADFDDLRCTDRMSKRGGELDFELYSKILSLLKLQVQFTPNLLVTPNKAVKLAR